MKLLMARHVVFTIDLGGESFTVPFEPGDLAWDEPVDPSQYDKASQRALGTT